MVCAVDQSWFGADQLSVLALSSRFDGRTGFTKCNPNGNVFQYSLCRVVLMVAGPAMVLV